jgi:hypothetical protein
VSPDDRFNDIGDLHRIGDIHLVGDGSHICEVLHQFHASCRGIDAVPECHQFFSRFLAHPGTCAGDQY